MNLKRWWPPCAWGAVVLVATSIPNLHVPAPEGSDKVVHFLMYCMLAFLSHRALVAPTRRALVVLVGTVALLGAADEWHQQFIPGRSMDVRDWAADATGGAVGAVMASLARPRRVAA